MSILRRLHKYTLSLIKPALIHGTLYVHKRLFRPGLNLIRANLWYLSSPCVETRLIGKLIYIDRSTCTYN